MCDRPVGQAECHRLSFASALEVSGSACGGSSRLQVLSSPGLPKGWVMSWLCSPACSQPLSVRAAAKGFMGISILFGSLGAAPASSCFPALSCQGHTLTCSAATLAHWHSAQDPCSRHGLHLCHSLWLSEVSISQHPTFRPLQKHQTLHSPGVTQQLSATKKSRSPFKHPNAPAALRGAALRSPAHPQDNLFLFELLSTQLQRSYVEIKMQSNKDAALLG